MTSVGSNISIGVSANISDLKAKMAGAKKEVQGLGEAVQRVGGGRTNTLGQVGRYMRPMFKEMGMGGAGGVLAQSMRGIGAGGMLGALAPIAAGLGTFALAGSGMSEAGRKAREGMAESHKLGVSYGDYERISKAAGDNKEVLAGLANELKFLSSMGSSAANAMAKFRASLPGGESNGKGLWRAQSADRAGKAFDTILNPRKWLEGLAGGTFSAVYAMTSQSTRDKYERMAEKTDIANREKERAAQFQNEKDKYMTPGQALQERLKEIAEARRGGLDDTMAARAAVLAGGQYQSALGQSASMPGAMTEGSAAAYSAVAGYQGRGQDWNDGQAKMIELLTSIDKSLVPQAERERHFQHAGEIP
jgi:hypothetical protein